MRSWGTLLCQKLSGRCDNEPGKFEFHVFQVTQVVRDDMTRAASHGKFDEMIVPLVAQVGPPAEVDARPTAIAIKACAPRPRVRCRPPRPSVCAGP